MYWPIGIFSKMTIAQIARNNLLSLSQSSLMVGTRYEQLHGQNQGGRLVAWIGGSRAASSMPLVRRSAMFRFDIILVCLDGRVEMAMDDVINVRSCVKTKTNASCICYTSPLSPAASTIEAMHAIRPTDREMVGCNVMITLCYLISIGQR